MCLIGVCEAIHPPSRTLRSAAVQCGQREESPGDSESLHTTATGDWGEEEDLGEGGRGEGESWDKMYEVDHCTALGSCSTRDMTLTSLLVMG